MQEVRLSVYSMSDFNLYLRQRQGLFLCHRIQWIFREMWMLSAHLSSWGSYARSLDQSHVYNFVTVCAWVCVFYLGTAVRVASGTRLELTDPELLLLGVGGYKDRQNKNTLIKLQVLTSFTRTRHRESPINPYRSSHSGQYAVIRKPSAVKCLHIHSIFIIVLWLPFPQMNFYTIARGLCRALNISWRNEIPVITGLF